MSKRKVYVDEAAAYKKCDEASNEVAQHEAQILRSLCELAKKSFIDSQTRPDTFRDLLRALAWRDEAREKYETAAKAWRRTYKKVKALKEITGLP